MKVVARSTAQGQQIIPLADILTIKMTRYLHRTYGKVRIRARGNKVHGKEANFIAVAGGDAVRAFLAVAVHPKHQIRLLDVSGAFLFARSSKLHNVPDQM